MHDLIYCFRMLRKRPSFTLVAVLTLALAIGASTALFSIVNVVVLNPFPYKDPSRLFFVRQSLPKIGVQDQFRASGPEFVEFAKSGVFERVTAFEDMIDRADSMTRTAVLLRSARELSAESVVNSGARAGARDEPGFLPRVRQVG